ncbi:hypothetical protein RJ639_006933 [Escallonia herrerae]|uniref:Uncharacterized protein n=1 Tax=Escallonia herrerae TaxID=1293975 RepID=A0AA88VVX6_9ASTE|nr:hypothetical protein RJ639_006933 [Escallonia herrerae]
MEVEEEKFVSSGEPVINYRGVKAVPFIIGKRKKRPEARNEAFEKLGTLGTSSNLLVYLTTVFNMKSVTAATFLSIYGGTTNMAPLLGAFLADSCFGRYKTLAFASGMTVIMLTAILSKMHPPHCGTKEIGNYIGPSPRQMAFLLTGFSFLTIGAGGIRPCSLPFGADQFNPATESGKRGINSFFNWYFFTFTFALMVSVTGIVYVQSNVSWAVGLAIPTCLMFMSVVLFFLGSKLYVKVKPKGSPFTSLAQVVVSATKKQRLKLPHNQPACLFNYIPTNSINVILPHTNQFRFLDKSAIATTEDEISSDGSAVNPWRLCSMQQVEEAKCVIRVIPIWASAIIYHVSMGQQHTYAVLQALQSDRHVGSSRFQVPAASYVVISMLTLTIWIPIYDRVIVPSLRKITGKEGGITLLQRTGFGILLSILTMAVSAFVEQRRRHYALTRPTLHIGLKGGAISSMPALWLAPQFILAGLSEAFNSIAQFEFYYKELPECIRSVAGSLFFLGMAVSSYLSGLLISLVHQITEGMSTGNWLAEDLNKGKLDYFYYLVAALGFINFGFFLVCARWYRYKGVAGGTD